MTRMTGSLLALILAGTGLVLAAGLGGVPRDVQGFAKWTKVATKGLPTGGPHAGQQKVVYANPTAARAWKGTGALPAGSIVVKTAGPAANPTLIAIMRRTASGWTYEEYVPRGPRYGLLASGALCSGCHEGAKAKDFLFTRP